MVKSRERRDKKHEASADGSYHELVFQVGEHVDCLDTVNKWCNAEVLEVAPRKVFLHYTGFKAKYDEWIDLDAESRGEVCRIQKQWRRGMSFILNNRVDVLDQAGKWLPAGIVQIETDDIGRQVAVKVHFVGYKPKWDEIINLTTEVGQQRIREIGAFSGAHGYARYNQAFQERIEYERASTKTLISQIK